MVIYDGNLILYGSCDVAVIKKGAARPFLRTKALVDAL